MENEMKRSEEEPTMENEMKRSEEEPTMENEMKRSEEEPTMENEMKRSEEEVHEEESTMKIIAVSIPEKNNTIQVSSKKKPLYFYVHLAKKYMMNNDEVELSALGTAIGTVVTVTEILKNNGFATAKKIQTSTVRTQAEGKGKLVRKAKIEITLEKSEGFDKLVSPKKNDKNGENEEAVDSEIVA